jgi:hypothetical protein
MRGIGGFVASARSGKEIWIEPGTTLEETMAALEGHLDADTLRSLARSSGVAKSRPAETNSPFPLCEAHPALADQTLAIILDEISPFATGDEVAKAHSDTAHELLRRTEAALERYFDLLDAEG